MQVQESTNGVQGLVPPFLHPCLGLKASGTGWLQGPPWSVVRAGRPSWLLLSPQEMALWLTCPCGWGGAQVGDLPRGIALGAGVGKRPMFETGAA